MCRIMQAQKLIVLGMLFAGISMGYPARGFAYTVVKVAGETAGIIGFSSAAEELNIYSTRSMYYDFRYDTDGVNRGYIDFKFTGFTGNEIAAPVPPGTYNFTLNYNRKGQADAQDIYWSLFTGFRGYPGVYIYDRRYSYVRIRYDQTITGEITVADMGQTRALLKFSETDGQVNLVGQMLTKPLKVNVVDSGNIAKEGVDVAFSVTPIASNCSFSGSSVVKAITVKTLADGTVEVPFKLGDVPETCTIKAVCDSCAAGKEVLFSAKAISDRTRINGKIKSGKCDSLAFGERTIPVNTDGTFMIDDVRLVAKEENGTTKIDYESFITGSCQVDVLCPDGAAFLGDQGYPGCGNGAHRSADPPNGYKKKRKKHYGIDIHGAEGFVVRAAKAGTVIHVGEFAQSDVDRNRSFGWIVITKSKVGNKFEYIMYGHLQDPKSQSEYPTKVPKRPGDIVNAGDPIGLMGTTGNASGGICPPHVHIEMRQSTLEIAAINNTEFQSGMGGDLNSGMDMSKKFISSDVFLNTCVKRNKKKECIKRVDPKNKQVNDVNSDCELGCKYYGKCTQKKK